MYATQIIKNTNGEDFTMAALVMQVNGFQFQVKVYIALDEGSDYYRIYGEKDGIKNIIMIFLLMNLAMYLTQ